ncbi:FecR domain-containing protein [Roseiarcus sp.]|uniref:FecR domain-containing protein n=1 Tax=Roseiarcus sp. TaxID=1969460 RepID=UPI003F97010B
MAKRPWPRKLLTALCVGTALAASALAGAASVEAAGVGCKLMPNDRGLPGKILRCGDSLTVRPAAGAHYRIIRRAEEPLPIGLQLDDGAILIEFHPTETQKDFEILTPLAIAGVRGTKWAMEVVKTRTSTLVLDGAVAVTSRRLNEYVVLTAGQGVDISVGDTTLVQKQWGQARVRALMSRFGE